MQRRRFECFDQSHSPTARYQPQARHDPSKKSRDNQVCILGRYHERAKRQRCSRPAGDAIHGKSPRCRPSHNKAATANFSCPSRPSASHEALTASVPPRHFPFVIPSEVEESLAAMADERKTLERPRTVSGQMTDIERLRHSAAHVLATSTRCHPEPRRRRKISQCHV